MREGRSAMNDAEDNQADKDIERVRKHTSQLSEFYDTAQIIVTKLKSNGSTRRIAQGSGNWYARYGSVKEWITEVEEKAKQDL